MKVKEPSTEQVYVDHCNPEDLQTIIDTHDKVTLHMKSKI